MTIDEAIAHEREAARRNRNFDVIPERVMTFGTFKEHCLECAKEHEQLAEWLEELKELREIKAGHLYATAFNRGYKKAISEHHKPDSLISECRLQNS